MISNVAIPPLSDLPPACSMMNAIGLHSYCSLNYGKTTLVTLLYLYEGNDLSIWTLTSGGVYEYTTIF